MKKLLIASTFVVSFLIADDYDPLKFERPSDIVFEGHVWKVVVLEHSKECPCCQVDDPWTYCEVD